MAGKSLPEMVQEASRRRVRSRAFIVRPPFESVEPDSMLVALRKARASGRPDGTLKKEPKRASRNG